MKRILVTIIGFIFGASLPIYALFIWEPKNDMVIEEETSSYSEEYSLEENESSTAVMNNIDFFKVNKEEIKSSMSKEEIENLKSIIKKLSAIDIMKIDESLEKNDAIAHTEFVINTVKTRLSDDDYKKFEDILSKYIDFSLLDEEI